MDQALRLEFLEAPDVDRAPHAAFPPWRYALGRPVVVEGVAHAVDPAEAELLVDEVLPRDRGAAAAFLVESDPELVGAVVIFFEPRAKIRGRIEEGDVGRDGQSRSNLPLPAAEPPGRINRISRAVVQDDAPHGALTGKVAVVVGGASGLGRTVARALAQQGARVVIADFDVERMERTVDEILHLGSSDAALALTTDVRSDSSVKSLAADAVKAMGAIDILINLAGVFLQGPLAQLKPRDWRWMLETNLLGTVRTTLAFLPHMIQRGSGHIVNAVSTVETPTTVAYDSGAAAVAAFTRGLAAEVAGKGVRIELYAIGSQGPRIGQNTRTRGMKRLLHPADDLEEPRAQSGPLVDQLIAIVDR